MKRRLMGVLLVSIVGILKAQEPGFHVEGMESRALPVTGRKMTNVIFPVGIAAGVRVSRDVLVQKVRGVENVIELKALRREFAPTNLAVYGKDGRLYSFVLHYVEDTTVLDYRVVTDAGSAAPSVRLTGWPVDPETLRVDALMVAARRGFLHKRMTGDGLRLRLKGVYLRDSLVWLSMELQDRTAMGCAPGGLRIYTEDRKKVKRTATQELEVSTVYSSDLGALQGRGREATAVALHPLVVSKGKRLVIAFSDQDGGRQVVLRVKGKVLVKIRRL